MLLSTIILCSILSLTQSFFHPYSNVKKKEFLKVISREQEMAEVGTANLAWSELGFQIIETKSHLKMVWRDGKWEKPELIQDPHINLHIGATALHYGQSAFEGLKAFAHEDGVHIFRPDENAKRLQTSCERVMMAPLPTDLFLDACNLIVKDNIAFVPPYGSGGSLYLRPLLFGSGPRIGLQPSEEYTFILLVTPVSSYYSGECHAIIVEEYDRAAPLGVGSVKVAGNYAADLLAASISKQKGYAVNLYLDAKTRSFIEEFSTSNFAGIDNQNKKYVTPKSPSVLPSITNKCLMKIAEEEGYTVEQRPISLEELDTFDEVVAIGTAVVLTNVVSITKGDKVYEYGKEMGQMTTKLYDRVRQIQVGDADDKYNWNYKIH